MLELMGPFAPVCLPGEMLAEEGFRLSLSV
jgi:hypothetical protein